MNLPAPDAPTGFLADSEPTDHSLESAPAIAERLNEVVGTIYGLTYCDVNGIESRRRIRVSHIDYNGQNFYVGAYCFERKAYRLFRADRIIELVSLRTGEIHDSAMNWCRELVMNGGPEAMMRSCIHDLDILGLVARCDGHLHEQEVAFMVEHVLDALDYPQNADPTRMAKIADAIYPEETRLKGALRIARTYSPEAKRRLLKSVRHIVDADEVLASQEFDIASELQRTLAARSFR